MSTFALEKNLIYNMIKIQGIQVDIAGSTDLLLAKQALFIIEFEYDSKLLICHTYSSTVKKSLIKLIRKILGPKETNLQLRQALLQSAYITVQIKEANTDNLDKILKEKYDLIKSNVSYTPYGHNSLSVGLNKNEKVYANTLTISLINEIDRSAKINTQKTSTAKSSKTKKVYAYNKITGIYERSFLSTIEASNLTGVCQSNISMCCKGYINTAGNYIWSYNKMDAIEIPIDRRRKQAIAVPTTAELEAKRQQFITEKNQ